MNIAAYLPPKHRARKSPPLTAREAISLALQVTKIPGVRRIGPRSLVVNLILEALRKSGWKIVPRVQT